MPRLLVNGVPHRGTIGPEVTAVTYSNAGIRFLICPALVALGDYLFAGVTYAGAWQWVVTGAVLAIAGIMMDTTVLNELGHVGSFVTDTIVATFIVWGSQFLLTGAAITLAGAVGTSVFLGLSEVGLHRWVQLSRRQGVRRDK